MRDDVDWSRVAEQYRAGTGSTALGTEHGVSENTVLYRLRQMGVPIRGRGIRWSPKADEATRAKWRAHQRKHREKVMADPVRVALHRRMRQLKRGSKP